MPVFFKISLFKSIKIFFQNLLLVFLSISVVALFFEGALRFYGFTYPSWEVRDREVGFIGLPNAKGWWTVEGHAYVEYNRHGFRDVERTLKKPEGTIRIAVLGDSYTQAREVPFETTFVNRAERQLALCNASAGRPIEMLNFGVASFNTPAQIQLWRSRVRAFNPDLVIFAFFIGNDISKSHEKMDPYLNWPGLGLPVFKYVDNKFKIDFSFRNDPLFKKRVESRFHRFALDLINRSVVLQFLNYSRHNFHRWIASDGEVKKKNLTKRRLKTEEGHRYWVGNVKIIDPPVEPIWKEAWDLTETGLKILNDEIIEDGARLALVLLPHPAQIDKFSGRYPQDRLIKWAAQHDIAVLDLLPTFGQAYKKSGDHPYGFENMVIGDGHLNALGHHRGADAIARWTCDSIIGKGIFQLK